jgi:hypothetical protein
VSARTPAEAAHGLLQDTLRDLRDLCDGALASAAHDGPAAADAPAPGDGEPDRWADEGGLRPDPSAGPSAGPTPATTGCPRPSAGRGRRTRSAATRVNEAVGAYARALRRDGVGLLAALAAVRSTVVQDGALLRTPVFAVVHQEAVRCCLEAFYAH